MWFSVYQSRLVTCAGLLMGAMLQPAYAQVESGKAAKPWSYRFSHKSWGLTCDNTRTCRAYGYATFLGDEVPASILLTREAGENTPVKVEIQHNPERQVKKGDTATLMVDKAVIRSVPLKGNLSRQQAAQLVPLLLDGSSVSIIEGKIKSQIPLAGAKAVLTKMDYVQGRLDTPSAIVVKGSGTQSPLSALPAPVIQAAAISTNQTIEAVLEKTVKDIVKKAIPKDTCPYEDGKLSVDRLSRDHLLVSLSPCWTAAYNSGDAFWVVEQGRPHRAFRVEDDTLDHFSATDSMLTGVQKGRGIGDCLGLSEWVWDGKAFQRSKMSWTGECSGFPGGAWEIPSYVTRVLPAQKVK
jgi:hypothetical protein